MTQQLEPDRGLARDDGDVVVGREVRESGVVTVTSRRAFGLEGIPRDTMDRRAAREDALQLGRGDRVGDEDVDRNSEERARLGDRGAVVPGGCCDDAASAIGR